MTQATPTHLIHQGLKVLIVEDDPDARQGLQEAVRRLGHCCTVACDGLEAWDMHRADHADVVLSDWNMPGLNGLGLCKRIRNSTEHVSYTHFIFMTGCSDKAHFIKGMQAGADDYITKPFDIDDLEARLEVCRRAVMNQREGDQISSSLRRKSDRDFHAARTDPLTSVSNRLELTEDLEVLASRLGRYGRPYSAALCDIDRFKDYNDYFGHLAGDDVLRRVAHTVHDGLRRGDGFYRYGGEEFVAILRGQSLAEAAAGMDRVRHDVEQLRVVHAPGAAIPFVTISVGIAELAPDSLAGTEDWLRRADNALYKAKASGRNCVITERGELPPRSA